MVIILMGVSGAGKTTVGRLLAQDLGWPFYEGDDFHPQSNIDKMAQGIPLTDADRWPWLDAIGQLIDHLAASGQDAIISCSALKEAYRQRLRRNNTDVSFVYLKGDRTLIHARMTGRQDHFMRASLLESQFQTLEEPADAVTVDTTPDPPEVVWAVKQALGLSS